jgi:hypothetical protein
MKKLNRVVVIGLIGIVAAGVLTQGTPSLAAQNVVSKNAIAPTYQPLAWFTFKQAAGNAVAGAVAGGVGTALIGTPAATVGAAVGGVAGAAGNIAQQAFHAVFGAASIEDN